MFGSFIHLVFGLHGHFGLQIRINYNDWGWFSTDSNIKTLNTTLKSFAPRRLFNMVVRLDVHYIEP